MPIACPPSSLFQTFALAPDTLLLIYKLVPVLFVAAYGACIGSLLNVVVYRLPRNIGLVYPGSSCPACHTKLTWRENIPIFGWIFLGGRCRFCKSKISPEYPIVEAFVAGLFGVFASLYYVVPNGAVWLGINWGAVKPEWAQSDLAQTWPVMLVLLVLLSCLVAMTLIDAKTTTIPLALPWLASIVAVVVLPLAALYVQFFAKTLKYPATIGELSSSIYVPPFHRWVAPIPNWWWLGASIGGILGIGVALLLVRFGLIRRSFADYEEWEAAELAKIEAAKPAPAPMPEGQPAPDGSPATPPPPSADPESADDPAAMWIAYPHARREMVRELAFIAPCGILGWLGGELAHKLTVTANPDPFLPPIEAHMPLWLAALGAVLLGYLIGGGVVWVVRIFGSLAFGKEALGLGDVHMMAAVGSVCGWIDATLAFFVAAFVGLAWFFVSLMLGGKVKRTLPYGPYLAVATVIVLLCKPLIEMLLNWIMQNGAGVAPINLP